jgi:hypothetical protein
MLLRRASTATALRFVSPAATRVPPREHVRQRAGAMIFFYALRIFFFYSINRLTDCFEIKIQHKTRIEMVENVFFMLYITVLWSFKQSDL